LSVSVRCVFHADICGRQPQKQKGSAADGIVVYLIASPSWSSTIVSATRRTHAQLSTVKAKVRP